MTSKNILLIGPTESGKSTLGNVIINKSENFEKFFEEEGWTRETKIKEVEVEKTNYRIIDTVGWDWDDNTSPQQILTELAQVFQAAERKIDRILLLMKGRGDWDYVITAFSSLKELDSELLKHITIVWSNFVGFEEQEECDENIRRLKGIKNPRIAEIVNLLPIIHVNNSPISTSIPQKKWGETEEEFRRRKEEQEKNKERRKSSRRIVLDHLKDNCQETYHVDREKISNFLNANPESSEAKTEKTTVTETRNILLIGSTKTGKSVLGNVLVNKNDNFEEVFEEGNFSSSKTKKTQSEKAEIDGISYQIIDTVSLGHTSMDKQQVASELTKSFRATEGKINQILLVIEQFDKTDCLPYHLIKEIDEKLLRYTTIIHTKFIYFQEPEKCQGIINELRNSNSAEVSEIANCLPIINIDNPQDYSLDLNKKKNETEEEFQKWKKLKEKIKEENIKIRKLSRQRVLGYLKDCQEIYQLENMDNLEERIRKFLVSSEKEGEKTNEEIENALIEEIKNRKKKWKN